MGSRLELHEELVTLLGSRNVYFSPPASVKMRYPAIVYSREDFVNRDADDLIYNQYVAYRVIAIDEDPDSEVVAKLAKFRYSNFENHYTSDGLNHDVFRIYY